jgi:hypothetical protein
MSQLLVQTAALIFTSTLHLKCQCVHTGHYTAHKVQSDYKLCECSGRNLRLCCSAEAGVAQSAVSNYGLDNLDIGVQSPAEAKGFFL